ncbi:MAG: protease inhibitor I42 family protein [Saprospiraceae bacterium]
MKARLLSATVSWLLLACACGSPNTTLPAHAITQSPARPLTIRTGEKVSILLEMPTEPGYNWYYAVSDDWVISMIEPYDYPSKSGNSPGTTAMNQKEFRVTGLKPGKVVIRFYQMNPAIPNGVNNSDVQYTVDVQ